MNYDERMPVVAFRVKKETKELLQQIADDSDGIKLQVLCRKIVEAYLRQKDMFELAYKKEA